MFSPGYQSDSEDNISEIANEIVVKVIEGDRGTLVKKVTEPVTYPKENVKPPAGWTGGGKAAVIHRVWQSDHIQQTAGDTRGKKREKKTKSVHFSDSPPPPPVAASSSVPSIPLAPSSPSIPPVATSGDDSKATGSTMEHQWKQVVPSASKARS